MGSGRETARATAAALRAARREGRRAAGAPVPAVFGCASAGRVAAIRSRRIAVLDRTKEPGGAGEPLFQDVVTSLAGAVARGERATMPHVIGGRYGLSSKEFTPAMAKAAFDELKAAKPRTDFTLGINDDVSHTSLDDRRKLSDREGRRHPSGVLRPRRRRNRRRQQEQRQDHRRGRRVSMRRAISSTIRTNPGRRRSRICVSVPSRSRRRI